MTVEEKAYNYASKVAKNRLTASEIAAHYGRGYIEGQEDMKLLAPFVCVSNKTWRPASELPPVNTEIVIWTEVHSPEFENAPVGYVPILGRLINGKWPSNIIVKWWCYPPEEEEEQ